MDKLIRTTAALCIVLPALAAGLPRPASAISPDNKLRLEEHFASLGEVEYQLFSPFGGAETAAVLLDLGNGAYQLRVMAVDENGRIDELINEPFTFLETARPFTFFMNGRHFVSYHAREFSGLDGRTHVVGDLLVRDLTAEGGAQEIYRLARVVDLDYSHGGLDSTNNMLAQPSRHFLNSFGRLPRKDVHFMLAYNYDSGSYELKHPVGALPDAAVDEAANYNNRAIMFYYAGNPLDASRLLEQSWVVTDFTQNVVQQNQRFVKAELEVLGENGTESEAFDEALSYYWQGDFKACLHVMEARYQDGLSNIDKALLALSLARLNRWAEADDWAIHLAGLGTAFEADFLAALMKIAEFQGHDEIFTRYREALAASDPDHPAWYAASGRALRRAGQGGEAESLLSSYLNRVHPPERDLSEPLVTLYEIYRAEGDFTGMQYLEDLALSGDVWSLLPYVHMADYQDLSGAMVEIERPERDRIEIPDTVLEGMLGGE